MKIKIAALLTACTLSTGLALAQMPPSKLQQQQITAMLTPKSTCNIVSFQQAFTGRVAGANGLVTVGLEDLDPENCGGGGMMPPTLKIVAFERIGSALRQLNSDAVDGTLRIQKIEDAKVEGGLLLLKLLVFGPNDPMCCAKTMIMQKFQVRDDRLVRVP